MSYFGTNIKKIRQIKGLSQQAFAELIDLNRGVISSYEEGRAEPKIETVLRIANYFGLTSDELLSKSLSVNQLSNFSDIEKILPNTPSLTSSIYKLNNNGEITKLDLQKILAKFDLIYEVEDENQFYPIGTLLFLSTNISPSTEQSQILVLLKNKTLKILSYQEWKNQQTKEQSAYKIIGHLSVSSSFTVEDLVMRIEKLERMIIQNQ